jgi:NAD(P)H-dependent flavin oxidoreductase YrpB (nitropropane dioxygenase family)
VAVSNAGGLGSLPCAMLTIDAMRKEFAMISAETSRPFNVNFFCHASPAPDFEREAAWRMSLARYYEEFGIRELGPISAAGPAFPLASSAITPLRMRAESLGSGDFSPLWSGQNASGCKEISAADLTREVATDLDVSP